MFQVASTPIEKDIDTLRQSIEHPEAGAYISFEGWVRNHNEGHAVEKLTYEAYESLALSEGNRIIQEALERFQIKNARCVHRVGTLALGEMAVWVGVTSAHRGEAFKASRYIIDEIKTRLPLWKKEFYTDLDHPPQWVNCQTCASSHDSQGTDSSESDYYTRQSRLPEVGASGQALLKNSRVLVVGAGGLGCSALLYLAGAGIGTLGICDPDHLQIDNLHRQILYNAQDVGQPKAQLAANRLQELNPFIQIISHIEALTPYNASDLLNRYDWILDCTDNFKAKFLINDAAVLFKKPLIQASIYQYEGQLQGWHPQHDTPCLRCHWPEIPDADCVGTCAEVGVLGGVPGILGTMQALEVVKQILGLKSPLPQHMLLVDLLTYQTTPLQRSKNPLCPLCSSGSGSTSKITQIIPENYEPLSLLKNDLEMDLSTLSKDELNTYQWLDIRDLTELPPLDYFKTYHQYLLFCNRGIRSLTFVQSLREQGLNNVYSVFQGYPAVVNYQEEEKENKKLNATEPMKVLLS